MGTFSGLTARRRGGAALVTAVMAALVLTPLQPAQAADLGGFEVDGNVTPAGTRPTDWAALGSGTCVVDGVDDASGYKGSESSDVDSWSAEAVSTGKTDIVAIQTHSLVDDDSGHQWTYVAIQRATTEGSTYFTFEYNQKANHQSRPGGNGKSASVPTRTTGDLRLQFEQQGNSANEVLGKIVVEGMDRWIGGKWVAQTVTASAIAGLSNTVATAGLCGSAQAVPGAFMEVALDLTVLGMEPGCESGGFGTFNVRSRQSPAETSEMSDVATGTASVQPNCGAATITKRGPSGAVVGDSALRFEISPDPRDGKGSAFVNDNVTADLDNNEVADVDERPGYVSFTTSLFGEYTVTEVAPPEGYLLPTQPATTVTIARYSDVPIEVVDPLGTGTVAKVDATTGKELGGAEFTFTKTAAPYQGTQVTVRDGSDADLDDRIGFVRAGGLYTGTWTVRESKAPAGYVLDSTPRSITVSQQTPNPVLLTAFENKQDGQLVWAKVGEDGQTRLAGASFRLERVVSGEVVETIAVSDNTGRDTGTTGRDGDADAGEFHLSGLTFGTWRVVETQAPDGYLAAAPQTVELSAKQHLCTFSFVNTENGQVAWRKVNEFGTVLDGAGFTLSRGTTTLEVTDNTGVAGYSGLDTNTKPGHFAVTGLDFGDWTLSETTVPQGYAGGAPKPFTVTATSATVDLRDVVNTQDGRVSWTKVGEDGKALAGAEFTLSPTGGKPLTVTDNTGQSGYAGLDTDPTAGRFALEGLDFGDWTLTESVAPLGYTGLVAPIELSVSAQKQTVDLGAIRNTMNGRLAWSKVDEDGAPLRGATFTLTMGEQTVSVPDNTGQQGYQGADTNTATGVFAVAGLDFGTWTLTETVVPQGYSGTAPLAVEVVPAQTPILLGPITNHENGQATWTKVGEHEELLGGAVFTLSLGDQSIEVTDNTGQDGYTGRDLDRDAGEFAVTGLDFGTWTLTETQAPAGYSGGATAQLTVTAADSRRTVGAIANTEDGRLVWRKTGEDDTPLAGAGFTLTMGDQTVAVPDNTGKPAYQGADTDERAGHFAVAGLDFGTWTVSETTVPSGYARADDRRFTISAQESWHEFTIVNSADGELAWTKVGEGGEALRGAFFELSMGTQVLAVTDNTGEPGYAGFDRDPDPAAYRVVGLDFGTWTLTETQAPTGYTAAPSRDVVVSPGSPTASFGAVVNHEDGRIAWTKVGEDGTPIAGAGFTLTTPGQSVVVDDYTGQHDYSGRDLDPDAGEFAVDGLDFGTWTLEETTAPSGYAGGSPVTVHVPRSGAVLQLGDIENTEDGRATWTKVGEEGEPLAGAGFTLTLDGQTITVDDFTGQEDYSGRDLDPDTGEFAVEGLDFGTWTLAETTVPLGYAGAAPLTFTVDGEDCVAELGDVVNTEDGAIGWTKTDDDGRPLAGAVFELTLGDEVLEVRDNTGQKDYDGLDDDTRAGEFAVDGLDFGTWTLEETRAPSGYVRDTDTREVSVEPADEAVDAGIFVNVPKWAGLSGGKKAYELAADGEPVESDGTVDFGDEVLYGIDVRARGSVPQTGVTVTDVVPDGTVYEEGSAGCDPEPCAVDYDEATGTLTWWLDTMEPREVVTVYFLVTVEDAPALAPGDSVTVRIDNVATVESDLAPQAPTNLVRLEASASASPAPPTPPTPSVTPPTGPQRGTPVPPRANPPSPTAPSRTPLARTGVDGLPQLAGTAALLLVLGTGMWTVAARRED